MENYAALTDAPLRCGLRVFALRQNSASGRSPWYPTARLFRQDERRDYASVVDRLRSELVAMISAGKAR